MKFFLYGSIVSRYSQQLDIMDIKQDRLIIWVRLFSEKTIHLNYYHLKSYYIHHHQNTILDDSFLLFNMDSLIKYYSQYNIYADPSLVARLGHRYIVQRY
jgi:hypothetical protein